jgi:hypothetical protein
VRPIGGRVADPQWTAYGTDEFAEWLMNLHADHNVFLRVYNRLMDRVDRLELVGPRVDDERKVRKLHHHNGLGEAKCRDDSGAYRAFFKFGCWKGHKVIVFADGDYKTRDNFSDSRLDRAERAVDAAFAAFGVEHSMEW